MKISPIIMSAPMIRGLLESRKLQTRRIVKNTGLYAVDERWHGTEKASRELAALATKCPYGKSGDLLWVRESVWIYRATASPSFIRPRYPADVQAGAHPLPINNGEFIAEAPARKTPSIHMPRILSRLTLQLTSVRIERLNDISEHDALAEGVVHDTAAAYKRFHVPGVHHPGQDFPELSRTNAREMYAALWDCLNGSGEWLGNPWVWALSFRVHQVNIDALLKTREVAA